jgi:hypothetical protein
MFIYQFRKFRFTSLMRPCITVKMLQTVPLSEYINRRYGPLTEGGVGEKKFEFSVKYSNIDQIA